MDSIYELENEIALLPKGYISNKKIGGKVRHYLQWSENGKTKSQYIPDDEYEAIKEGIAKRKELEKRLKALKREALIYPKKQANYEMNVVVGQELKRMVAYAKQWDKRDCYSSLLRYLYKDETPRVCSIYGLRRTGKTTMLYQAIGEMSDEHFRQAAYIKARKGQSMSMLDRDLNKLMQNGYNYIFIDEVTFLEDFVDTASVLSDIYAAMGIRIVLSGTDSLGFWLAMHEELYDRTYMIHTTWISYGEHARLLGIDDIDEYIRYGGTLRVGETDFENEELKSEEVSFRDDESTRRYIDTAICGNIQHSLKCYQSGRHFRHLEDLYDKNELTNAINRVIEDINPRFVLSVLEEDFSSNDLSLAKRNLTQSKNARQHGYILDDIDVQAVTERLMGILNIRNRSSLTVEITEAHAYEIEEYLKALELIEYCPVKTMAPGKPEDDKQNILFLQPGMRYCQAQALVYSLGKDEIFSSLDESGRKYVCDRILNEVKGRMLEEIVLYETMKKLNERYSVFKLSFLVGEFDMVVYDKQEHCCDIYEIKHSDKMVYDQTRHLTDEEKIALTERRFGEIKGRYVLYRGETAENEMGILYRNVSDYLKGLPDTAMPEDIGQDIDEEEGQGFKHKM